MTLSLAAACLPPWASGCSGGDVDVGPPPVPAQLGRLDPPIQEVIRSTLVEVEHNPDSAVHRLKLGMVYAANELYESALVALEQATAAGLDDPRGHYHLALTRAELGDLDGAVRDMIRVTEDAPDYAAAHWQLGFWRLDLGDASAAERAFRRATEIDAADIAGWLGRARAALQLGENQRAVDVLNEYRSRSGRDDPYVDHLLRIAYRRLGRTEDARLAAAPTSGGRPELADPWRKELEHYEAGYQAQLDRAKECAEAGDYAGAIEILSRMAKSRDVTVEVYNNLGLCYLALKRLDEAVEVLRRAVALNPNSLQAHHTLAGAYWMGIERLDSRLHAEERRRILEHVERALEINPAFVPALVLEADVLAHGGDLEGAAEVLHEAARWDPTNPRWLYDAAMLHGRLRQFDRAAECLERVVELAPDHFDAAGRLGMAYMSLGRWDKAEQALLRARDLAAAPDPRVERALREVRRQLGDAPR